MDDNHEWQDNDDDDDDEKEEDDFIPGADDEDDGDYDLEYDDDEHGDPSAIPSFLEGHLFVDPSKGALCYEQEGVFCFVCQSTLPSKGFNCRAPPTGTRLMFSGWIQNPSKWVEFFVEFSRQAESDDPLEEKLLKAQDEKNATTALQSKTSAGHMKSDSAAGANDDDDDAGPASSVPANLKAPPSYSTKQDGDKKESDPKAAPPSHSPKKSSDEEMNTLVVMTATQIKDGCDDSKHTISFRGSYRPPVSASVERLCVISSVRVEEASSATVAAAAGASIPSVAAAAATSSRKRRRASDDDDDSVEGRGGVEYQELIDLHDDAGLSTEELRRRYYGGGDGGVGTQDNKMYNDSKKPAASKAPVGENEDRKHSGGANDNDSDDDDYGF